MAAIPTLSNTPAATPTAPTQAAASLLISLSPLDHDGLTTTLGHLASAFPDESVLVATPDATPETSGHEVASGNLHIIPYVPSVASPGSWLLTAPDFFNAYKMAKDHGASSILILGAESGKMSGDTLKHLVAGLRGGADLVMPDYLLGPRDGLVNSAILYPVTRALFGARPRYPLAIDMGLSLRMAEKLATAAQRFTAVNQNDALLWPVAEACSAGYAVLEVPDVEPTLPQPGSPDLNTILARVTGSLFADVDAKAALWQRIRTTQPRASLPPASSQPLAEAPDVSSMIETFRIGYTNLVEIWSLVLPPNSLLGLKRLSEMPTASFRMPDALWARTIFDFILAYRLRTLNRGHLLGALTPLYLAFVASHLLQATDAAAAERHIESVAAAFEADKPYLVSRWRWPDRFNP